ncbi:hypothetical protein TNCV_2103621 [Trichonephila clavipes]|nr:hypothetical protein TNCV_2103621 [Trichonephila clavipes]
MREDACVRTCQPDYIWSEKLKDLSIADVVYQTIENSIVEITSRRLAEPQRRFRNSDVPNVSLRLRRDGNHLVRGRDCREGGPIPLN